MISNRYLPAACAIVTLALVPTVIHSYAGIVVDDGRSTAVISSNLAGFTAVPSTRDDQWGQRRFESGDWFERRYLAGSDEVLLTVLRSYDLKRLYHHPELDVAYGVGYLTDESVELMEAPGVPVRLLRTSDETGGTAVYALHYGDDFVANPLWLQIRVAGELLFSGRRPMTLLFARDISRQTSSPVDSLASSRVLAAAIQAFRQPPTSVK